MSSHPSRRNARESSLGDRRLLVECAQAVAGLLLDARYELSPLQLAELTEHVAGLAAELRAGVQAAVDEADKELSGLRICLEATLDADDFLHIWADGGQVALSRLNPSSPVVRRHLDRQQEWGRA